MKYLKTLNELINSRDDLIGVEKSEIKDFIEPALLTQKEYLDIINDSNEWHGDDSYDFSINKRDKEDIDITKLELINQKTIDNIKIDFYVNKEKSKFGYYEFPDEVDYKKKNWIFYTDKEKQEKKLPLYNYNVLAYHQKEKYVVGSGQDEWGCVLIWTLKEYRGMGIGSEIVKIYRKYYPSKTSGGFTSFGYNQIKKYHAYLVRKYLQNGIYSDMVKKNEITTKKVKEITNSIKDVKKFNKKPSTLLSRLYGDTTNGVYIGDNFVIIYDKKLLSKYDNNIEDPNIEELVYGKSIKSYGSFNYSSDRNFADLLTIYSSDKDVLKITMNILLSLEPNGLSNKYFLSDRNNYGFKELKWLKELVENNEYITEKVEIYKDIEYYDVIKIKKPIENIKQIQKDIENDFKKNDEYGINFNILIEEAESKTMDNIKNNLDKYLSDMATQKVISQLKGRKENYNNYNFENMIRSFFKSYYGDDEWENVGKYSTYAQKKIESIIDYFR